MKNNIKIPIAFQIRLDDVAWHIGHDQRTAGKPSRTGIPRLHHVLDYPVINELGKALNSKIDCALVLGEWDKENILRNNALRVFEKLRLFDAAELGGEG